MQEKDMRKVNVARKGTLGSRYARYLSLAMIWSLLHLRRARKTQAKGQGDGRCEWDKNKMTLGKKSYLSWAMIWSL